MLSSTNLIENLFSRVPDLARRVKRWQGGTMILRWAAAAALEAERSFRRIAGYRELPKLTAALRAHDTQIDRRLDNGRRAALNDCRAAIQNQQRSGQSRINSIHAQSCSNHYPAPRHHSWGFPLPRFRWNYIWPGGTACPTKKDITVFTDCTCLMLHDPYHDYTKMCSLTAAGNGCAIANRTIAERVEVLGFVDYTPGHGRVLSDLLCASES